MSLAVEDDELFVELVRKSWKLWQRQSLKGKRKETNMFLRKSLYKSWWCRLTYHSITYNDIQWHAISYTNIHWHTILYNDMQRRTQHTLTYNDTHTHTHIHSHTDIQQHTTYNDIQWHTLTYTDIQRHTPTSNGMPWHIYNDISYVRMICKQSHNWAASNTLCKGFVWMLMFFFLRGSQNLTRESFVKAPRKCLQNKQPRKPPRR